MQDSLSTKYKEFQRWQEHSIKLSTDPSQHGALYSCSGHVTTKTPLFLRSCGPLGSNNLHETLDIAQTSDIQGIPPTRPYISSAGSLGYDGIFGLAVRL